MSKSIVTVDLKPDSQLIDRDFESYKISFAQNQFDYTQLNKNFFVAIPSDDQYSYLHQHIFSNQNNLIIDPFSKNTLFYSVMEDGSIFSSQFNDQTKKFINGHVVFKNFLNEVKDGWEDNELLEEPQNNLNPKQYLPFSLCIINEHICIANNGRGKCYFLDKRDQTRWKCLFTYNLMSCSVIGDARIVNDNEIHLLLESVIDKKDCPIKTMNANYISELKWLIFDNDSFDISIKTEKVIYADGNLEFVSFDYDLENLITMAPFPPILFSIDGVIKYNERKNVDNDDSDKQTKKPLYFWNETTEVAGLIFNVESSISENDISFTLSNNSIMVSIKEVKLIGGKLIGEVDVERSKFVKDGNKLEIILNKKESKLWNQIIDGDEVGVLGNGDFLITDLEQFSPDKNDVAPENMTNDITDDIEECDTENSKLFFLYWLNGIENVIMFQSSPINSLPLFSKKYDPFEATSVCLRENNDGIVWSFCSKKRQMKVAHRSTFDAFGYIQASKSRRKFSIVPPLNNYVAIIESFKTIYVYWRSEQLDGDGLVNRRDGRSVKNIAKLNVISMTKQDPNDVLSVQNVTDEILGCACLDKFILIALKNELVCITL
uniref:NudC domain-containing protein 1 n=1 Tax=Rhabditophanes sp. KR3021 TaxID=114890 RepID=A0AC35UI85_9BILA